jgi:hypothetical protein
MQCPAAKAAACSRSNILIRVPRILTSLFTFCALAASAFAAQGSQRISTVVANVGSNARVLANAQITVCSYNASNPTCTTPVIVYQDPLMTVPYAFTFRADGNGNYSYWAAAGNYVEKVCATGAQCQTRVITLGGSGSGGGGTPAGPSFAIQFANNGVTAFQADGDFTIDPTNHILNTSAGNYIVGAANSMPRKVFDPMDTNRLGGLAAALAGTSGHTPTEVIQATLDYAECQTFPGSWSKVLLPSGLNIPISQILVWTHQELSGESESVHPFLGHNDNTKAMIMLHGAADTVTCPNLGPTPVTPGAPGNVVIKNIGIGGMNVSTSNDIGIRLEGTDGFQCVGCLVQNISGGASFGGQGILLLGVSDKAKDLGYEDAQISGCLAYTNGVEPISHSPTGQCGAVEDDVLDGELDNVYSSDGAGFLGGPTVRGPGACYPNCAGFVFGGNNGYANGVFSQISDIGAILGGTNVRFHNYRIDGTSKEGVRLSGGSNILEEFHVTAPCTSISLQANYNSGVATGCFGLFTGTGSGINAGNSFTDIHINLNGGILGQSFAQAQFRDGVSFNAAPNHYDFLGINVNPNNTGPNDWPLFTNVGIAPSTPPVVAYSPNLVGTLTAAQGTANISGVSMLEINTSTPLTHVVGGIPGQIVTIYANFGGPGTATINHNPSGTGGGIITCSKQPTTVSVTNGAIFQYSVNNLVELGCDTQLDHSWINWFGNPTPSAPSFIDFYGNIQARKSPAQFAPDFTNLHGSTTSGSACFVLESVFSDGSHVVSPQACTSVNLAALTPGGIFASDLPQAAAFNMYLVSNTQANGVPLGKFGAGSFQGGSTFYWDGPTTIAAGGNGTVVAAGDNNTGEYWAVNGVLLSTSGTQPTCGAEYQGLQWIVRNATTGDVYQICQQQAGGSFAWSSPGGGGPATIIASSETVTFSATPTFATTTRASIITLTGNITSFTLAAAADGQEKTLTFCQNGTGSFTVAPPTNVHGFMTVGTTASKCNSQHYTYSVGQSAWLADSSGVINE